MLPVLVIFLATCIEELRDGWPFTECSNQMYVVYRSDLAWEGERGQRWKVIQRYQILTFVLFQSPDPDLGACLLLKMRRQKRKGTTNLDSTIERCVS